MNSLNLNKNMSYTTHRQLLESVASPIFENFNDMIVLLADGKIVSKKINRGYAKLHLGNPYIKFGATFSVKFCNNLILETILQYQNRDGILYEFCEHLFSYLDNLFKDGEFGLSNMNATSLTDFDKEEVNNEEYIKEKKKLLEKHILHLKDELEKDFDIGNIDVEMYEKIINVYCHILVFPSLLTTSNSANLNPTGIIGSIIMFGYLSGFNYMDEVKKVINKISIISNNAKKSTRSKNSSVEKNIDHFKDDDFKKANDDEIDPDTIDY